MQKLAAILFFILYAIAPVMGHAAFVIKLKNGKEFVTGRYWQEGTQIMFDAYGGIFGVDKNSVQKIEQSDRRIVPEPPSRAEPAPRQESETGSESAAESKEEKPEAKQTGLAEPKAKEPPPKDQAIMKEFRALQQRYGRLNDLPTLDVYALSSDIDAFKRKLEGSNLAEAHQDEINAAATLIRSIESYLKAANR